MKSTSTGSSKDNRGGGHTVRDGVDLGSGRLHSESSPSTKKGSDFPRASTNLPVAEQEAHNPAMATSAERAMTRFLSRGPPSVPAVGPPLVHPPRQTSQPTQPEGQTPQSPQRRASQPVQGQPSAPQSPQQTTQTTPGRATQPTQEQKFQVTKAQPPQTAEGQTSQPAQQPAAANKQKKPRPSAVTASSSTTKG